MQIIGLTKISFDAEMKELKKSLALKRQVDNTLDITDKNEIQKNGGMYFENDGSQNYLVFQPIYSFFTKSGSITETIIAFKSRGLPDKIIKPPSTSDNRPASKLKWIHNSEIAIKFDGGCFKQDKETFSPKNVINLFIAYRLDACTIKISVTE